MRYQGHWIWIHKCFCSILYFVITVTSDTFIPSLTLSASIHARSSRLGNYTAEFMLQYNFLCRWNRRMNVKTFLDPIQTAWKFIAKHFSIVGKNECNMINEISNSKLRYCKEATKYEKIKLIMKNFAFWNNFALLPSKQNGRFFFNCGLLLRISELYLSSSHDPTTNSESTNPEFLRII